MKDISVSLVISTFKNEKALNEILIRVNQGTRLPQSIHIADDGSGVETEKLIKSFRNKNFADLHHHWHEDMGFRKCKILNKTISKCQEDYIIFLDGDCLPHKNFVKDHINLSERRFFVQGRRCFISQEMVLPLLDGKTNLTRLLLRGKISGLFKLFRLPFPIIKTNMNQRGLIGCNWAAWRKDLLKVNGFDEDYEGWGREDSDICTRLYNSGIQRKFVYGRSIVYHLNHEVMDKSHLKLSNDRLQETISLRKTRCTNGIIKD
jgi:GT2 family glycosyltransferase